MKWRDGKWKEIRCGLYRLQAVRKCCKIISSRVPENMTRQCFCVRLSSSNPVLDGANPELNYLTTEENHDQ